MKVRKYCAGLLPILMAMLLLGACGRQAAVPDKVYVGVACYNESDVFIGELLDCLKEQLNEVLGTLTEREQKVLRLRFGLDDGRARTLEEVGKEFNVTRERIRQIEAKALRKLRHPSRSRKLKDYLD